MKVYELHALGKHYLYIRPIIFLLNTGQRVTAQRHFCIHFCKDLLALVCGKVTLRLFHVRQIKTIGSVAPVPSRTMGSTVPGEKIVVVPLSNRTAHCLRRHRLGTKKSSNDTGTVADTVTSLMNDKATGSKKQ